MEALVSREPYSEENVVMLNEVPDGFYLMSGYNTIWIKYNGERLLVKRTIVKVPNEPRGVIMEYVYIGDVPYYVLKDVQGNPYISNSVVKELHRQDIKQHKMSFDTEN